MRIDASIISIGSSATPDGMGGGASSQKNVEQQQRDISTAANSSGAASSAGSVAAALDHVRATYEVQPSLSNDATNAKLKELEAEKKAAAANEDYERCSQLRDELAALREQQQSQHMRGDQLVFMVKSPKIPNKEAIAFFGDLYKIKGAGRGHCINLGGTTEALVFVLDGPPENCAVRVADDDGLALEV